MNVLIAELFNLFQIKNWIYQKYFNVKMWFCALKKKSVCLFNTNETSPHAYEKKWL